MNEAQAAHDRLMGVIIAAGYQPVRGSVQGRPCLSVHLSTPHAAAALPFFASLVEAAVGDEAVTRAVCSAMRQHTAGVQRGRLGLDFNRSAFEPPQ